jgi:hypothetical protein
MSGTALLRAERLGETKVQEAALPRWLSQKLLSLSGSVALGQSELRNPGELSHWMQSLVCQFGLDRGESLSHFIHY